MTAPFVRILIATTLLPFFLGAPRAAIAQSRPTDIPVTLTATPLTRSGPCTGSFIPHDLDHLTTTADGVVRMFQANGTGLAAGDLDNDGDLDLVLGAEEGANSLLWNEGDLRFRRHPFGDGKARDVTIVDVDGDGWRDIVLTRNTGALRYWRNLGDGQFVRETLPGVARPAYVLAWADLDGDGDLDLATASYDAGFLTDRGDGYLLGGGGGVYVYENRDGRFRPAWLASDAQALALATLDLDQDGRLDLLVGNDFGLPDYAFIQSGDGWTEADPFAVTTHSTMSFALGDVDNDGQEDLFASDMKPYSLEGELGQAYAPLMAAMMDEPPMEDASQIMENVLQMRNESGRFVNRAEEWGVDGTGWTWSSQFGDLDNDGRLDLYVVNGMMEERVFAHMPDHELVEENQAFRNAGDRFEPVPAWGLGSQRSGRGMVMADLDGDGDLDIAVNNLRAPAQLFENQLCGGAALEVELTQPGVQNRDTLGAQLILYTNDGVQLRTVRAGGGYLSGLPARVHFGFPQDAQLDRLEVRWPDGRTSVVDDLEPNVLLRVTVQQP